MADWRCDEPLHRDAPRCSCEHTGRNFRVGSGTTGRAGTDLRIVACGRFRTSKVVLIRLTGKISSAAKIKNSRLVPWKLASPLKRLAWHFSVFKHLILSSKWKIILLRSHASR